MLKKEARKILCMLMAVVIVTTGVGTPVNAEEFTEEMLEDTESETVMEKNAEEDVFETASTQTTAVIESEEETSADIETELETILSKETEMEEVSQTQQESTEEEMDDPQELVQASNDIASGAYGNTKWVIDSTGKLTVTGTGEYCSYPQWKASPWYAYREQIKTAVVDLKDIERPCFMFDGCVNMTSVDISKFDTSKSWDFKALFSECKSLKSIDLSRLDTSNATGMYGMFSECRSLEQLDLSNFNTAKVTSMGRMFDRAVNLKSITFGKNFKTDNVTDMGYMFSYCSSLQKLDVSGFNTSNVTYMREMFGDCESLSQLDVRNFNTAKVTDIQAMFDSCDGLKSLDLSSFDMGNVKYAERMLSGWLQITELHTPRNVKIDIAIPEGKWCKPDGTVVTQLPKNTAQSVKLTQQMYLQVRKDVTEYAYGAALDLSDLVVEWMSESGHIRKTVTNYTTNAAQIDMHKSGTQDLIITYDGLQAVIKITIKPQTVANWCVLLNSSNKPKNVYRTGEKPDFSGTYLGVFERDDKYISFSNFQTNINAIDMSTPGIKKLKVTWNSEDYGSGSGEADLFVIEAPRAGDIDNGREDSLAYRIDANGSLTIMGTGDVSLNTIGSRWGKNKEKIKSAKIMIKGAKKLECLLDGCCNLESVDLSETETSKVTSMYKMFASCKNLKSVDLSGFDTRNVKNMSGMFEYCESLTSLDLSGFDTGKVTSMDRMFEYCSSLTNLNLNSFNTGNVTKMNQMFTRCSSLTSLNLNSFDTRKVTDMQQMFYGCSSLTSLNLSGFNTEMAGNMEQMFLGCTNLTYLNLSGLKTGKITSMYGMFSNCRKLSGLHLGSFDTQAVTNMSNMFYRCESLINLDLSGFKTENVTDMSYMFYACKSLSRLDLSGLDTGNVTDMSSMFEDCDNLTQLDLSDLDTGKVTTMSSMFNGCDGLTQLDLSKFNTGNVTNMSYMFDGCKGLSSLNLSSFDTRKVTTMRYMFNFCESLTSLNLSNFDMGAIAEEYDSNYMFRMCRGLVRLWTPRNVKFDVDLYDALYDAEDTEYNRLPKDRKDSILLEAKKPQEPEEESSSSVESSKAEESSAIVESSKTEESSTSTESSKTEESSAIVESSRTEESSTSVESSRTEESSGIKESSETEESSKTEESSGTDADTIDLKEIGGSISAVKAKTYDGKAYEPSVKVTVVQNRKKVTLTEGMDYCILYQDNINAGEGTILVRGMGDYSGELSESFTIKPKSVKKLKAFANNTIAGCESGPEVYVFDGQKQLENGIDYTLNYDKDLTVHENASANVTIVAKGNYTGSKSVKFTVYSADTKVFFTSAQLKKTKFAYTGKAMKPVVTVTAQSEKKETLQLNKDYKVQYKNNVNVGTGYVIVTGKGQCKGKVIVPFEITPLKVKMTIAKIPDKIYNGKLQKPSVTVKVGTKKLSKNKDYTVTYTNNLHASINGKKAKVTITGIGNYAGLSTTATFTIAPQQIKKAAFKGTKKALSVTYSKRKLREGTDYEPPVYGAVNKNKVAMTIKGKGDFTGEVKKKIKVS